MFLKLNNVSLFVLYCIVLGRTTYFSNPGGPPADWYKDFIMDSDAKGLEHSGKMVLLFEILKMAEQLGDKV